MQITVTVPDELAAVLAPPGQDPARAALEAIALEACRERRLTGFQLRTLLGIPSRYELDGFLRQHKVYDYDVKPAGDLSLTKVPWNRPPIGGARPTSQSSIDDSATR